MPIVSIESVVANKIAFTGAAIKQLADELGSLWKTETGQTWVKVRYLDETQYAENGVVKAPSPTFVEVLQRRLSEEHGLAVEAAQVAQIVSSVLSLERENVHIIYLAPAAGRIAFSGNLVRSE